MKPQPNRASALLAVVAIAVPLGASFAGAATARVPLRWKNCTQVNKRYPQARSSEANGLPCGASFVLDRLAYAASGTARQRCATWRA
jgi:hypothetical protein